jgi:hypothetical protein
MQVERGADLVVVDNTNPYRVITDGFVRFARDRGYETQVIRMVADIQCCQNQHGVPFERIAEMSVSFQDYPGELLVAGAPTWNY